MRKKILFLGYGKNKNSIINEISNMKKIDVFHSNNNFEKIFNTKVKFDLIVSYGYKKKIDDRFLKTNLKIINLHTSYLPFNKGAHPNFWSFIENTPAGVSIHKVSKKIDSGDLIYQKLIDFELFKNKKKLTFKNTYLDLKKEIEKLFISNFEYLINNEYVSYPQIGIGTHHYKKDLPDLINSWDQNIYKTVIKYNKLYFDKIKKNLATIDQIENTRKKNNVNWMNILREAISNSPDQTIKILSEINKDDEKISNLFKKFKIK